MALAGALEPWADGAVCWLGEAGSLAVGGVEGAAGGAGAWAGGLVSVVAGGCDVVGAVGGTAPPPLGVMGELAAWARAGLASARARPAAIRGETERI